jgi:putative membrane protein
VVNRSNVSKPAEVEPTPRDYLANERTFLAYVRTALSFIAFGFIVARFALFSREIAVVEHVSPRQTMAVSTTLGVAMTVSGVALGIYGAIRYAQQDRALRDGGRGSMPVRGAVGTTLAVVAFGAIIAFDLLRIH